MEITEKQILPGKVVVFRNETGDDWKWFSGQIVKVGGYSYIG